MSYTVVIENIEIRCDTVVEALELARCAQRDDVAAETAQRKRGPGRPPKNGHTAIRENRVKQGVPVTLRFLREVAAHPTGANKNDLMRALGITEGRAIGGTMVRVISVLGKHDFDPKRVYRKRSTSNGSIWKGGQAIQEAIAVLEKSQGGDA